MNVVAAAVVVLLSGIGVARAGEFTVKNCVNADVRMKVKSYNATDLARMFPYRSWEIPQYSTATLDCETANCAFVVERPHRTSASGAVPGAQTSFNMSSSTWTTSYTTDLPTTRHYCFSYSYGPDGEMEQTSFVDHSPSGCGCR